ncbi:VapC toxin family PIN domain ribonuclease [Rubrivivax gelatinosus]|uniref:TA system VapC family ribonuclease toxin n=1 Tax=Rubrivivax gelatinosus TaxID=28068 RepID=UPI0019041A19|nr:TA system VapC family ribonuclease toxin [Rubrivivax gelatinosus]MBK1614711.1 VapC toxin family PIN domain ribonuclease [Rubrivivax gelatinosus]
MAKQSEPAARRALLDVNVLVALLDAGHLHHGAAMDWLAAHEAGGWASCPLTQHGCLRILSLPAYPNPQAPARVAARLAEAVADASHAFWPDDLSLLEPGLLRWDRVLSSRHITDLYLLALAVRHGGRLVTLDRSIAFEAVPGATPEHLTVIGAPA